MTMQSTDFPIISIITPNYNTEIQIIEFLNSIKNQDYPLEAIEVVVIDNGSDDESVQELRIWFEQNQIFYRNWLIELEKNMGIAYAYNVGYDNISSESKIIIRTESDIELESNCISSLVNTVLINSSYGVVGAIGIFFHDKKTLNHAARYINWWNGKMTELEPIELIECDCVFGGTFAIRRDIIRKMGYFFRPDRFLANELEFCTRVKFEDMKVVCQPKAVSYHKGGNTTGKLSQKKFSFITARESTLFHLEFNKHLNKITSVSIIFITSLRQLLKLNSYALLGFLSALVSFVTNKNVLLPTSDMNTLSEWLME